MPIYPENAFHIYKIDEINYQITPKSIIKIGKQTLTIKQMYKDLYNADIKDEEQPILIHFNRKFKKIFYLVPEFMQILGIPANM